CRIPQPAIAIIPIPRTTELLRQRGRRRRNDAARRAIRQCLERDQRTAYSIRPPANFAATLQPVAPDLLGSGKRGERVDRFGGRSIGAAVAEDRKSVV